MREGVIIRPQEGRNPVLGLVEILRGAVQQLASSNPVTREGFHRAAKVN
jgi:hypothetical protein